MLKIPKRRVGVKLIIKSVFPTKMFRGRIRTSVCFIAFQESPGETSPYLVSSWQWFHQTGSKEKSPKVTQAEFFFFLNGSIESLCLLCISMSMLQVSPHFLSCEIAVSRTVSEAISHLKVSAWALWGFGVI